MARHSGRREGGPRMRVQRIGVVGAGIMGRGIAQVAAQGGFTTTLQDVDAKQLDAARDSARRSLDKSVELQKLTRADADAVLARLHTTRDLSAAAATADLVIEAAPERIDLKLQLFGELDRLCAPE